MNKNILLLGMLLCTGFFAAAQKDYRVVFDMTSKDSIDQQAVIRWLNEITKAELGLAVKGKSFVSDEVVRLAANKNVAFRVCKVAMQNQGIDESQLLPGVQTVPDGIYEIISKQRENWGYIKVKN